jgi:protein O-mannosyl-transferase
MTDYKTRFSYYKHNKAIIASLILLVITFAIFYRTTANDFICFDDPTYVTDNTHVQEGLTLHGIAWSLTSIEVSNWHPLTLMSHMLDWQLYKDNPYGHHLSNVILHVINTSLLFLLLYMMTRGAWRSLFVASMFALHPLHVESVAWIAERKDVLSTLLMLLTMICYAVYTKERKAVWYILAILSFVLGLMSKPMLVTLPLLLLLLDFWPLKRFVRPSDIRWIILEKIPFILLMIPAALLTLFVQKKSGALSSYATRPFWLRLENALDSYIIYIEKMVWPSDLAIIYPLKAHISVLFASISGLLLIVVTYLATKYGRNRGYLVTGWIWYLISLLPVIGIVQVGPQAMADRYSYIPLIGLFIVISWGASEVIEKYRIRGGVTAVFAVSVIATMSCLTVKQISYWHNSIDLFAHAAESVPDNYIAYRILGIEYGKKGDFIAAAENLRRAINIEPYDAEAYYAMGITLTNQQKYNDATYFYMQAINLNPRNANAYYNYGVSLAYLGQYESAIEMYRKALVISPGMEGAKANIGAALYKLGRNREAVLYLQEVLKMEPENQTVRSILGNALSKLK